MPQAVNVTSPLGDGKLVFQSLQGREELGRLFEFRVELLSSDPAIVLNDILGQNVTLAITFPSGSQRYFNGDVVQFRQLGKGVDKYYAYEAVLCPRLWFLGCTSDCKIFQQQTAPDIIKAILDEHGITDVTRSLSETYATREYCVQYNETDLDFISRLMEEEGIYYFFQHADGKHTLVLADSASAHSPLAPASTLPFRPRKAGYVADESVYDWVLHQQVRTTTYAHTDYDFTKPRASLAAQSQIARTHLQGAHERFAYPGIYTVAADGTTIAKRRIERWQIEWETISGKTNCTGFATGALFTLSEHVREDQNREHLVIATEYHVQMETATAAGGGTDMQDSKVGVSFDCSFRAIDSARTFRPAPLTPKPIMPGPQTAAVVGKSGEEIWTDSYGRVKVQFHWDRLGERNENSSCWLRVAQSWAGKNWGAIHIPRIGEEVIVEFLDGDPDRPIVTGRVYNAEQTVPYALPANQTQSGLKTRSSKTGNAETYNELRFEDKKDAEQIYFHAEKDFHRVVENNDILDVGLVKKDAGDQTITIHNHRTVTLNEGNDTLLIKKGNRATTLDKGNQTLTITEGSRTDTIKTDDALTLNDGNQTITIEKGNQTITIKKGNQTITIEAGKCAIEAAQEMLLKVGDSTIKITPSSIEMASVNIKLTADGQFEASAATAKVAGSGALDLDGGTISIN